METSNNKRCQSASRTTSAAPCELQYDRERGEATRPLRACHVQSRPQGSRARLAPRIRAPVTTEAGVARTEIMSDEFLDGGGDFVDLFVRQFGKHRERENLVGALFADGK